MLLDRFLPACKRQRLDVDVDRLGKPGHKIVLHLRVFLSEDDVVRQKDAAGLQDARILLERAFLVLTDEHRKHRLVDDDIEARILEGKRESAAADDGKLVFELLFLDIFTRFFERRLIEVYADDFAAVPLGDEDHRRPHVARNFKNFGRRLDLRLLQEPVRRVDAARAQLRLPHSRQKGMSCFTHDRHLLYIIDSYLY